MQTFTYQEELARFVSQAFVRYQVIRHLNITAADVSPFQRSFVKAWLSGGPYGLTWTRHCLLWIREHGALPQGIRVDDPMPLGGYAL